MRSGEITYAQDLGTIWILGYKIDGGGEDFIHFDHGCFADLYEGATCRSFYEDYKFGAGRQYISDALRGLRIRIHGEDWERVVSLED